MIVDYHMHLRNGRGEIAHDSKAVEPFVHAAHAAGLDEIGFSEHVYYFRQTRPLWHVPYHVERCVYDIETYVGAIVSAKERGLPVKLGLEVDYEPGREDATRALLEPYPWDYLLGSIHFINDFGVDGEPTLLDELGLEQAWRSYFERLPLAASSGLFDSLSHPDLVKIFGRRPAPALEEELHRRAVDGIAGTGVAVEVSTAGLRKPVAELYPDPHFLALCRDRGIPVTTGSDAHSPDLVGRDFDRARALLRSTGYDTITVFERREAIQVPIA